MKQKRPKNKAEGDGCLENEGNSMKTIGLKVLINWKITLLVNSYCLKEVREKWSGGGGGVKLENL